MSSVMLAVYAPLLCLLIFNCWNYIFLNWKNSCFQNKLTYFLGIIAVLLRMTQFILIIIDQARKAPAPVPE